MSVSGRESVTLTGHLFFKNFFHKEYFILKRRSFAADLLSTN